MNKRLIYAILVLLFLASPVSALAGPRAPKAMKDEVLNLLFPINAKSPPYRTQITLRYGDTDTELIVTSFGAYPMRSGGQAEVAEYSIEGLDRGGLSAFIDKEFAREPGVTARGIAERLSVAVRRFSVNYDSVKRLTAGLGAIRISPALRPRSAFDEYSRYDLWFSTGQEYVHYSLVGPFKGSPQDSLVDWMITFRTRLTALVESGSRATR